MQIIVILIGLVMPSDGSSIPGPPAVTPEERQAFEAAKAGARNDPGRLIKLGLWAESKRLDSERDSLLREAVRVDPKAEAARGLLGQVGHERAWDSPEQVGRQIRNDARRAALLAEYHERRALLDQAEETERRVRRVLEDKGKQPEIRDRQAGFEASLASKHLELGEWCEAKGLRPEAIAHYTSATVLDPYRDEAWLHLGYVQYYGRWMSREQIIAEQKEQVVQHQADRHWGPLLSRLKSWLGHASSRADAERELAKVVDPRALPTIIRLFVTAKSKDQEQAVRLLGQISAPKSSQELAFLAVRSEFEPVRRAAIEALKGRDAKDYAEPLVKMIRARWIYLFVPVRGPGAGGMLAVESPRFHLTRTYDAPVAFTLSKNFRGYVGLGPDGLPLVINGHDLAKYQGKPAAMEAAEERTVAMIASAQFKAESSRMQMISDINEIRSHNASADSLNSRIIPVLEQALGAPTNLGDDEDAWNSWYYEKIGYRYTPEPQAVLAQSYSQPRPPGFTSCFAAGTPVRTIDGPRAIETLKVGDQVLSQDVTTGGLSFQPILVVHHNPPDRTLKVALENGDLLVASRFHRFWLAGRGWVMARDLKVGDVVRTLAGCSPVRRIDIGPNIPVFNLDVAIGRTFFVGNHDALVHDNTMPATLASFFDEKAVLAGVGPSKP